MASEPDFNKMILDAVPIDVGLTAESAFLHVAKHAYRLGRSHGRAESSARVALLVAECKAWRDHKSLSPVSLLDAPITRACKATDAAKALEQP